MVVVSTSRIKALAAYRAARFALHVLVNAYLRSARSAEYCHLVPFTLRPDFDLVIGEGSVAILAGIVNAAALHLDGDDVSRPVIMLAAGL